jgi:hypothetical protein
MARREKKPITRRARYLDASRRMLLDRIHALRGLQDGTTVGTRRHRATARGASPRPRVHRGPTVSCAYRAMSPRRGMGARADAGTSPRGRLRHALTWTISFPEMKMSKRRECIPARVRPHMGPASTRVRSSTRIPSSAYWMSPWSVRIRLGASPILVIDAGLMFVWKIPWGVMSITSNDRSAAAQRCLRNTSASNSSADHSASAVEMAALVGSHCRMSSRPCLWLDGKLNSNLMSNRGRTGKSWYVVSRIHPLSCKCPRARRIACPPGACHLWYNTSHYLSDVSAHSQTNNPWLTKFQYGMSGINVHLLFLACAEEVKVRGRQRRKSN